MISELLLEVASYLTLDEILPIYKELSNDKSIQRQIIQNSIPEDVSIENYNKLFATNERLKINNILLTEIVTFRNISVQNITISGKYEFNFMIRVIELINNLDYPIHLYLSFEMKTFYIQVILIMLDEFLTKLCTYTIIFLNGTIMPLPRVPNTIDMVLKKIKYLDVNGKLYETDKQTDKQNKICFKNTTNVEEILQIYTKI
jgi:hypothetical protein